MCSAKLAIRRYYSISSGQFRGETATDHGEPSIYRRARGTIQTQILTNTRVSQFIAIPNKLIPARHDRDISRIY